MRFSVLVAAAVVITSVNAGLLDEAMGCVGLGGESKSRVRQNSQMDGQGPAMPRGAPRNEQEPVVSQESAGREPKPGPSQDSSENDSEPGVPQGPSGNRVKLAISILKLKSGVSHDIPGDIPKVVVPPDSPGNGVKSGPSQDPSDNGLESTMAPDPSDDEQGQGPSQDSRMRKLGQRLLRNPMVRELKSVFPQNPSDNGQELKMEPDPSNDEQEQGPSQDPSDNGLESTMAPDPSDDEQGQGPSQDSRMRKLGQRLLRNPMVRELKSVFPQGIPWHNSGKSKDPEPEEDPVCTRIKTELRTLWVKIGDLSYELYVQMPGLYKLIMMKGENKGKKGNLKAEKVQKWFTLNSELIPKLQEIKAKYDDFGESREEILGRFDENECPETFKRVSLEELTQNGYLPKWKDTN
ncbi:hypothetical protein BASA60_002703, partial [Batrachochytrium salamandrivorans]